MAGLIVTHIHCSSCHKNVIITKASKKFYASMTDEYPILFVMAALIKGISTFKGIGDLANKESNRILEMQKILNKINIKSKVLKDEAPSFSR